MQRISLATAVLFTTLACGDNSSGNRLKIADECNPLGGTQCMMPWPSNVYLNEDDGTASGFQLDVPIEAMPINGDGIVVDPASWNRQDGFSAAGAIVVAFPGGVSEAGLPPSSDPAASRESDSPVMLIEVESGYRPIFFAEVDQGAEEGSRALFIRPLERLKPATRYAVAIRDTVRGPNDTALERPTAFAALLEGTTLSHPHLEKVAEGYPAIFADIEGQGVERSELVLAWEFVTASDESLTRDLLTMRDTARWARRAPTSRLRRPRNPTATPMKFIGFTPVLTRPRTFLPMVRATSRS